MKRITFLILALFCVGMTYGQQSDSETEKKLGHNLSIEAEKADQALLPSVERAPVTNTKPLPGYVQKGLTSKDFMGYAWNAFEATSGVVEGPVSVSVPGGVLSSIQFIDSDVIWMTGGDFAEDVWYAVNYDPNNSGLYTIDIETGNYTLVGSTGFSLTGLAYDHENDIMYGTAYSDPSSYLYTIDLTTGAATQVGVIGSGVIIGIAADIDGNLYGLNLNNSLYSIAPTGQGTEIGPIGHNVNYAQDIGFDRDNGILYGTLYTVVGTAGTGGLYQFDLTTGAATLLNSFIAEVCAFGIPYSFAEPGAPNIVTDFDVQAGAAGAMHAVLTWTNPSVSADGSTLTELTSIVIERDGEVIQTISSPAIGGAGTYTDNGATEAGIYNYRIYGINSHGEGLKTAMSLFVGPDVPASVSNLELEVEGNGGQLTWDAPVEGLNGGYFSTSGLAYTIVRYPGEVEVATAVTATTYLDDDVPGLGNYYYSVTASNDAGTGGLAVSNVELLGGDGLVGVTVGTGDLVPAFRVPFDLWYKNSLAQTIYYPDELGIGGTLHGVIYYNTFTSSLEGENVRIYAAVTELEDLSDGFVHGENFTLVFEGEVEFPAGENSIIIPFDQPFQYTGGNLVLMTNNVFTDSYNGASADKFLSTTTEDRPARMRHMQSDSAVYDPTEELSGGTNRDVVPNTTLLFSVEGMGSLAGTVKDDQNNPLEGVKINVDGTSNSVYSDDTGAFLFPYLQEGQHSLTASLLGYADATATVNIVEDQQATVDFSLTPVGAVVVSGFVASDEDPGTGLEGAEINLTGYADYTVITGSDGTFQIQDVFVNQTYNINVSAEGHLSYNGQVIVGTDDLVVDNIILEATDMVEIVIGEGDNYPPSRIPFDFYFKNSLSQTLYYPEEIGVGAGAILSLAYTNNFATNLPNRAVKIWIGETELDDLSDGWVDPSTLTLVYDGVVDFPSGENTIHIEMQNHYIYTGGNLVIYTYRVLEDEYYSTNDRFYGTEDAGSGRTRRASSDSGYNPSEPPSGSLVHWHPNTTIAINVGGLGSLEGVVTDGTNPVEGVLVKIEGTFISTLTDANGFYEFPYLVPDNYSVEFSKFGFDSFVADNIVVEADETTTLDVTLNSIPQFTVSGVVKGNDDLFLEGAVILLEGMEDHTVLSNPSGSFTINDVYEGTYSLTVSAVGYETSIDETLVVDSNTDLGEIILEEIIETPSGLVVMTDNQEAGNALFMWNTGEASFVDSFEDGTFDAWDEFIQGPGTPGEGGFSYWLATDDVDGDAPPHGSFVARADWGYNIDTWIISPSVSVQPNSSVIFNWYSSYHWSVDPNPNAELMVKVSTDGGTNWTSIWNWQDIGVWENFTWYETTLELDDYIGQTVKVAFHLIGDDNAVSQIDHVRIGTDAKAGTVALTKPVDVDPTAKVLPEGIKMNKAFLGYNVFLDGTQVATAISDSEYLFTGLSEGNYVAGVQSNYTTGTSDIVTIDFDVVFGVDVTVEVTTNSGDSPLGAEVMLSNTQYEYSDTAGENGEVEFLNFMPGTYTLTVNLSGFETFVQENINITEDITITAELVEIIENPYGLIVEWDDLDEGEALFSWNNVMGNNWAESFEGGALPGGWDQIINNTTSQAGFASTWYITGTVDLDVPIAPQDGSYQAFMMWSYSHQDEWLITPEFTATGEDLTFWYYGTNGSPNADNYYVKVSADGGNSWDILWNASDLPEGANHYSVPAVIDLSDYAGQDIQIAWNNVDGPTNDGLWFAWAIDNITVGTQKIDVRDLVIKSNPAVDNNPAAKDGSFAPPVTLHDMGFNTSRSFVGYNVFINDMTTPVATEITSTEFMFTGLADGEYTAGVQSVYTSGASEIVTLDFDFDNGVEVPEGFEVVFNVDMQNADDFDPDNDVVYIAGIFDWEAPGDDSENQLMVATDDPMIYTITLYLPAGEYEYKYFINAGWDGGEWDGVDNREITVDDDMVINDVFGDPGVNVPEVDLVDLKLFPNPASTILNVVSGEMITEIRMIDMLGQVVYTATVQDDNLRINVGQFKDGVYFVQILTSQGISTQRVQITR